MRLLEPAGSRYRQAMRSHLAWIFVLLSLCATIAACASDDAPCNVEEVCIPNCTEQCAPEPLVSVACVANACRCICETSDGGGTGGDGGMSGSAGTGGAGGQ